MTNEFIIYGLYCPITDSLHYVGKSGNGMLRPFEHMVSSHSSQIREWVGELKMLGYRPNIKILETCNKDNLSDRELFWINDANSNGCYLLNKQGNSLKNILNKNEYKIDNLCVIKIGNIIKNARLSLNISAEDLSSLSKISRPTLFSIEKGDGSVRISTMVRVLAILGLKININKTEDGDQTQITPENGTRVRVARRKNKVSEVKT